MFMSNKIFRRLSQASKSQMLYKTVVNFLKRKKKHEAFGCILELVSQFSHQSQISCRILRPEWTQQVRVQMLNDAE